nr:uncharacterized protein LOC109151239 [Ipomoea trifida]
MAAMQAGFIAVQCCQCSTMQVKQRKKSSNKWICVVCNQKQSLRQVFAQGFMAKDVRIFVQNFNMSRQFSDLAQHEEPQTLDLAEEEEDRFPSNRNNKRTDWTEYLDFEDESVEKEDEQSTGDGLETRIVTELPKAVFKRPKLSNYSVGSESDSKKRFRPTFTKRDTRKQSTFQGKDIGMMAKEGPDREDFTVGSQDVPSWSKNRDAKANDKKLVSKEPTQGSLLTTAKGMSKWSEYMTADADDDDDDNLELESGGWLTSGKDRWNNIALENPIKDHKVDEDIHPDFM